VLTLAVGNLSAFTIVAALRILLLFHWDHHRYTHEPRQSIELIVVQSRPRMPIGDRLYAA